VRDGARLENGVVIEALVVVVVIVVVGQIWKRVRASARAQCLAWHFCDVVKGSEV
jgi:hypothetical protein